MWWRQSQGSSTETTISLGTVSDPPRGSSVRGMGSCQANPEEEQIEAALVHCWPALRYHMSRNLNYIFPDEENCSNVHSNRACNSLKIEKKCDSIGKPYRKDLAGAAAQLNLGDWLSNDAVSTGKAPLHVRSDEALLKWHACQHVHGLKLPQKSKLQSSAQPPETAFKMEGGLVRLASGSVFSSR